jgi:glutathione S-transferase
MPDGRLYIGNRRYSSWSMRGWLAVRLAGLDVEEVLIHFTRPGPTPAIHDLSPNGLVPCLEHRGARVWESLAVCEYCAEITPSLWPADRIARAYARAISAEMHAGFTGLRQSMWMNLGRDFSGLGRTPDALPDVAARNSRGNTRLLRCGSRASAGERLVRCCCGRTGGMAARGLRKVAVMD